jgi:hypothetical protein
MFPPADGRKTNLGFPVCCYFNTGAHIYPASASNSDSARCHDLRKKRIFLLKILHSLGQTLMCPVVSGLAARRPPVSRTAAEFPAVSDTRLLQEITSGDPVNWHLPASG